ncbi:hypothetical protein SK803_40080 [Lentzea sp. BCCO 10_0856]|uniref:HEAT repeat-containing protein n=1 Tax=Lentzea miocenica TaxID=3095431 RepID=A0ABU4TE38_9PSEU|nr:hypothetical protein [Lentzea sp. BCCO 10_0856]MDX8036431.1 hypothetical protein [Lentzea sp. BCCO 10_0856]
MIKDLDAIDGTEGPAAVRALIGSLRSDDYTSHMAVYGALELFPPAVLSQGTIDAVPELLEIPAENSGEVLLLVAAMLNEEELHAFNVALGRLEPDARERLADLVTRHEQGESLADDRTLGRLRAE